MPFASWLKTTRIEAGKSLNDIADVVIKSKTWLLNIEKGKEAGGQGVPNKGLCLALGEALGLRDPEEVWRRGRQERLEQLDPDLARWVDNEARNAQVLPHGMPEDVRSIVGLLLDVPELHREQFFNFLYEVLQIARTGSIPPGLEGSAGPDSDGWSRVSRLGESVVELTRGYPAHKRLDLLTALTDAQLTVRDIVLQMGIGHPSGAEDALKSQFASEFRAMKAELKQTLEASIRKEIEAQRREEIRAKKRKEQT